MKQISIIFLVLLLLTSAYASKPYVEKPLLIKIEKKYKVFAKKRFFYQQKALDSVKNKSDLEKLDAVNKFYNKVRYSSDLKIYGKKDYWATPWQFLGKDMGDCEDYVISKYFALVYLGVDPAKLFFTYVRSTKFKAAHMVLTYFKTPRSIPLVLDNNNHKVLPATKRKDLTPVYNFNGSTKSLTKAKGGKKVNSNKANTKWNGLLRNMKLQKY